MVESHAEDILRDAETVDVAFLVVGDPFGCVTCALSSFQEANFGTAHGADSLCLDALASGS